MLRVIVVDDEWGARAAIKQLLAAHSDVRLVGEAANIAEAVALIQQQRPDVIFLDIELNSGSGFDVVSQLENPPTIVFVTAHSQFALEAYDVAACDYLLKPVRPHRLARTIDRLLARRHANGRPESQSPPPRALLRVRAQGRLLAIPIASILALRAEKDYTTVFAEGRAPLLVGQPIGRLKAALPSPPFMPLDRSIVINANRIAGVQRRDRSQSLLSLEGLAEELKLGRTATSRLASLEDPKPRR